jgi:hypothetical protein
MENRLLKEKLSSFSRRMESVSSMKEKEMDERQKRVEAERDTLRTEIERLKNQHAHKERIFQQKITDLDRIVKGQQRRLAGKDRQLSLVKDAYDRVNAIIGSEAGVVARKESRPAMRRKKAIVPKRELKRVIEEKGPLSSPLTEDIEPEAQEEEQPATPSPYSAKSASTRPYKAEEIVHMVRVAADHGDSKEAIRDSLISSGYDPIEVDKAISQVL